MKTVKMVPRESFELESSDKGTRRRGWRENGILMPRLCLKG